MFLKSLWITPVRACMITAYVQKEKWGNEIEKVFAFAVKKKPHDMFPFWSLMELENPTCERNASIIVKDELNKEVQAIW